MSSSVFQKDVVLKVVHILHTTFYFIFFVLVLYDVIVHYNYMYVTAVGSFRIVYWLYRPLQHKIVI